MRSFIFFALFLSLSFAATIGPRIFEQDDFGDPSWEQFVYSVGVDCEQATIKLIVMDGDYQRVEEANTYLKYVDYSSPLISSNSTGGDGVVLHKLPGSTQLMRGLFILVIEKQGFRTKEVHFDIYGCYAEEKELPEEEEIEEETETTEDYPDEEEEEAMENITENETDFTENITENKTADEEGGEEPENDLCLPALLIPLLAVAYIKSQQ